MEVEKILNVGLSPEIFGTIVKITKGQSFCQNHRLPFPGEQRMSFSMFGIDSLVNVLASSNSLSNLHLL